MSYMQSGSSGYQTLSNLHSEGQPVLSDALAPDPLQRSGSAIYSATSLSSETLSQKTISHKGFSSPSKAASQGKKLSTRGSRQRLIGTAGNDILESFRGAGKNLLKGNQGNDKLFAGISDRLLGDAGSDLLDARKGKGNNLLLGGAGDDTLYAKSLDQLNAGAGNDILWAGLGGSQLIGGQGADQFWIANRKLPGKINTIKDFNLASDVIGVNNVPGVTRFSDLTLTQQGKNTLVKCKGKAIAILTGVQARSLTSQHFIGLQSSTLSISDVSVSERDTGQTSAVLEVVLNAASTAPVTVNFTTAAGTATPDDNDYTPVSGTLTFAPGETSQVIVVNIPNDTKDELDETFNVVLSNPTNAVLANTQAQVTIIDNDITSITATSAQSDGSKTNNIDARYDFNLYDITAEGDYRRDEEGNTSNDVGIFSGAIENFTGLIREVGVDPFLKFDGLKIGGTTSDSYDLFIPEPLTLDLRAQSIPRGGTITFPDGTTTTATRNRIEYKMTNARLQNEAGLFEWTLILDDALLEEAVIDPVKAVNSIEYIIANQLLAKADLVRFSVTSKADPQKLEIITDNIDPITDGTGGGDPPPRVITRNTPPAIPRPVPYNNAIAPTNDAIATASDTGLSSNGFRTFSVSTAVGFIPPDFSTPPPSNDVDLYKLQLKAGEIITVDINSYSQLNSVVRVFDANGTQLAFSDDSAAPGEGASQDSYIQFQATTTGTYYIGVSGFGNSAYNPQIANSGALGDVGNYTIEMDLREPNSIIATAIDTELYKPYGFFGTTTRIGDTAGFLAGLDVDFYKVQLDAGDTLTIDIDTSSFAAQGVDSVLRLFNADGVQVAFNDNAPAPFEVLSTESYISYIAAQSGTYYVGVSGFGNSNYNPLTATGVAIGDTGFYSIEMSRTA